MAYWILPPPDILRQCLHQLQSRLLQERREAILAYATSAEAFRARQQRGRQQEHGQSAPKRSPPTTSAITRTRGLAIGDHHPPCLRSGRKNDDTLLFDDPITGGNHGGGVVAVDTKNPDDEHRGKKVDGTVPPLDPNPSSMGSLPTNVNLLSPHHVGKGCSGDLSSGVRESGVQSYYYSRLDMKGRQQDQETCVDRAQDVGSPPQLPDTAVPTSSSMPPSTIAVKLPSVQRNWQSKDGPVGEGTLSPIPSAELRSKASSLSSRTPTTNRPERVVGESAMGHHRGQKPWFQRKRRRKLSQTKLSFTAPPIKKIRRKDTL